jgi:hypothetical protein
MPPWGSKGVEALEANWHHSGDANFTGLKAPLDLLIQRFYRSLYTYRSLFWEAPVVGRCLLENRTVWRLWKRIGDANFTRMKAALDLAIRRFQRCFYTYKRLFWQAPVVRRCFLRIEGDGLWGGELALYWRCKFHSNESTIRPTNTALSAMLLHI